MSKRTKAKAAMATPPTDRGTGRIVIVTGMSGAGLTTALKALGKEAEARFHSLRLHNITARIGDGHKGWPEQAPFSRIIVTAATKEVPPGLIDQLAPGGILVVPVGREGRDQVLLRLTRGSDGHLSEETLGEVRFVPLVAGLPEAPAQNRARPTRPHVA